jgi:hypothetical protein
MELNCRTCGSPIPAEDINIDLAIAKCRSCNAVFGFRDLLDAEMPQQSRREWPRVPMPKAITVEEWGRDLLIRLKWFSPVIVFLIFFCIAWDAFLVFWYYIAFTHPSPLIMKVFPIGHLAVGVGLTYYVIAALFNRTRIQVISGMLTIRHGPVPWSGNVALPSTDIDQIYSTEHVNRGRGTSVTYAVNAMLADGRKLKLLSGLTEAEQALFIEQKLEDTLGITHRHVPGEFGAP